uniref:Uncharacterized protein n=1 Tax=Sphaeramia orbicularis TaxID=375764 RepID=A0A673A6S2_9TELE
MLHHTWYKHGHIMVVTCPVSSPFRAEHPEVPQTHKPLPLPSSQPPPLPLQPPPPPPPRSQDSSSSSGPSDPEGGIRGGGVNAARRSNSSDGLLDRITTPEEDGQQGALWVNGLPGTRGGMRSGETDGRAARTNSAGGEGGGRGGGAGRGRGGGGGAGGGGGGGGGGGRPGYSEVLLDYVWGKQQKMQQLQRQQSHNSSRQPITSQLYNGYPAQQPSAAPPTYRGHHGDQRRVKVTRTKSCGPFLPVQQGAEGYADTHNPPLSAAIQPDPHPHLLPPRPQKLPPTQDAQLEEATRSLHKALALEGLRDWYLRNTIGVKGQAGGGGALQRRRTTHGVIQQSTYQTEASHHAAPHHKQAALPHSLSSFMGYCVGIFTVDHIGLYVEPEPK